MKKKTKKILLTAIITLIVIFISVLGLFMYELSPVNSSSDKFVSFTIEQGWGKNKIIHELKNKNLIKNELCTKILLKLNDKNLYAGTYKISQDMSTNIVLNKISNQENIENETITITFVEGKRLSTYIKQISENFDIKEDSITEKLNDKDYLNTLIDKYWFLTADILNEDIYNPLEGYLYPDTYEFKKNSTLEEIINKLLTNMEQKLNDYKDEIDLGTYTIHQYLTLASIVELEGVNSEDRGNVAGVFYNRLNSSMTLGSDVTTYYAVGKTFADDLTQSDLNSCNGYNTRGTCVAGLPIGPICSPSLSSIVAAIEPVANKYYYFVADNAKKTYFSETSSEHAQTVSKLKSEGKWYTY